MKLHYNTQIINLFDLEDELFNKIVSDICDTELEWDEYEGRGKFSFEYLDENNDEIKIEVEGELSVDEFKGVKSASLYDAKMYITIGDDQVGAVIRRKGMYNDCIDDFMNDVEIAVNKEFKTR